MTTDLTKRLQRATAIAQQIESLEKELASLLNGGQVAEPVKRPYNKKKPVYTSEAVQKAINTILDRYDTATVQFIHRGLQDFNIKLSIQAVAQFCRHMARQQMLLRTPSGLWRRKFTGAGLVGSAFTPPNPQFQPANTNVMPTGFEKTAL